VADHPRARAVPSPSPVAIPPPDRRGAKDEVKSLVSRKVLGSLLSQPGGFEGYGTQGEYLIIFRIRLELEKMQILEFFGPLFFWIPTLWGRVILTPLPYPRGGGLKRSLFPTPRQERHRCCHLPHPRRGDAPACTGQRKAISWKIPPYLPSPREVASPGDR